MTPAEILAIVQALLPEVPAVIAFIKGLQQGSQPGTPQLTDAQALAVLNGLALSTIQVDENWKASHP